MNIDKSIGKTVFMPHDVSYGETDTMEVVYYAEYLHICERARNYLGREIGFRYKDMEEKYGLYLPVREAEVRYRAPVRYDDRIYVGIGVSEWKKASIRFVYTIFNEDKSIVHAEASTLHACINKEGKVYALPPEFKQYFLGE